VPGCDLNVLLDQRLVSQQRNLNQREATSTKYLEKNTAMLQTAINMPDVCKHGREDTGMIISPIFKLHLLAHDDKCSVYLHPLNNVIICGRSFLKNIKCLCWIIHWWKMSLIKIFYLADLECTCVEEMLYFTSSSTEPLKTWKLEDLWHGSTRSLSSLCYISLRYISILLSIVSNELTHKACCIYRMTINL
jgi:hypothetical protein